MARTLLIAIEEDIEEERATMGEPLKLNIYDLTCMNRYMYWFGLGVYHSAVEAYGKEYAYGAHEFPTSGVFEVQPHQCPGFKFRKSLTLGTTWMGPAKFREFVEEMACEYTGDTYHLLYKNCNHFCEDVSMRLVSVRLPGWINRLAQLGSLCSCFLPRALQEDGIYMYNYEAYEKDAICQGEFGNTYHYEAYENNAICPQEEFGHLALAIVKMKKRHLISFLAFLSSSRKGLFPHNSKLQNLLRNLSQARLREL